MQGVNKGDVLGQVAFLATRFGVAASAEHKVGLHTHRVPSSVFATQPSSQPWRSSLCWERTSRSSCEREQILDGR